MMMLTEALMDTEGQHRPAGRNTCCSHRQLTCDTDCGLLSNQLC